MSRRERVTVDYGMRTGRDGEWVALPGVVIAEVKQLRFSYDSDFLREMRHLGVRPGEVQQVLHWHLVALSRGQAQQLQATPTHLDHLDAIR